MEAFNRLREGMEIIQLLLTALVGISALGHWVMFRQQPIEPESDDWYVDAIFESQEEITEP